MQYAYLHNIDNILPEYFNNMNKLDKTELSLHRIKYSIKTIKFGEIHMHIKPVEMQACMHRKSMKRDTN